MAASAALSQVSAGCFHRRVLTRQERRTGIAQKQSCHNLSQTFPPRAKVGLLLAPPRFERSSYLGFGAVKEDFPLLGPLRKQCQRPCQAAAQPVAPSTQDFRNKQPKDINVLVVGPTGYIGKFVTKELINRGYNVIAVAREKAGIGGKQGQDQTKAEFAGGDLRFGNTTEAESLERAVNGDRIDVVVSCLASRTGGKKDSWLIDYQATKNSLDVGRKQGAQHFVLLSAICVQKPLLEFQKAKLKLEEELQNTEGLTWSIVRPTAFFKSLGGQVESVKSGGPYVMFGDGKLCACKPISEADLASYIADCVVKPELANQVLPIGGPGKALTPAEQGEMLFRIVGRDPTFIKVPIQLMDGIIGFLDLLAKLFPGLEDGVEFGKIGRYYAAESMLVLDPKTGKYDADATPSYGKDTLEAFFEKCVREGMAGQELGDQAVF